MKEMQRSSLPMPSSACIDSVSRGLQTNNMKRRNISRLITLKEGWLLKITYFSATRDIALGITRKEWLDSNSFSTRIFLTLDKAKILARKLQGLVDKAEKEMREDAKKKQIGNLSGYGRKGVR